MVGADKRVLRFSIDYVLSGTSSKAVFDNCSIAGILNIF